MIPKTAQGSHALEISGYSMHCDDLSVPSAVFSIGGYGWEILFFPRGVNEPSKDYVSVYVFPQSKNNSATRDRAGEGILPSQSGGRHRIRTAVHDNNEDVRSRIKCVGVAN
ncbi:hypothetical protein ACQ4PT_018163 [Festuca glaucescens]